MSTEISIRTPPSQQHGSLESSPSSIVSDDIFMRQRLSSPVLTPIKLNSSPKSSKLSPSPLSISTTYTLSSVKPPLPISPRSTLSSNSLSTLPTPLSPETILIHPPPQDNQPCSSPTSMNQKTLAKKVSFQNNLVSNSFLQARVIVSEPSSTLSSRSQSPRHTSPPSKTPLIARKSELKHSKSAETLITKQESISLPNVRKPISRSASANMFDIPEMEFQTQSRFLTPPEPEYIKRKDSRISYSTKRASSCSQLPVVAPCRLVNTFQKFTEHRKNLKTNPTFDNLLFEYEETLGLDETMKTSNVQLMAEFKKKANSSQIDLKQTNRNIGRDYAKGMDPKSLLALCDLKRSKMKLDYFFEGLSTDLGGDLSKSKVEKNLSMIKESMDAVLIQQQNQSKKKKRSNIKL